MTTREEKTPPDGPFAMAVDRILTPHLRDLRRDLIELIEKTFAEHEQKLADHELRIQHFERVIRESKADTERPRAMPPGSGP